MGYPLEKENIFRGNGSKKKKRQKNGTAVKGNVCRKFNFRQAHGRTIGAECLPFPNRRRMWIFNGNFPRKWRVHYTYICVTSTCRLTGRLSSRMVINFYEKDNVNGCKYQTIRLMESCFTSLKVSWDNLLLVPNPNDSSFPKCFFKCKKLLMLLIEIP